jgi:hypothetical protein
MSKELVYRNKEIYIQRHVYRKSYKDIACEFGITETRVRQILEDQRLSRRPENAPTKQYVYEIEMACLDSHAGKTMRGRIYNALANVGLLKRKQWKHLSKDQLMLIPNLGKKAVDILLKAQQIKHI